MLANALCLLAIAILFGCGLPEANLNIPDPEAVHSSAQSLIPIEARKYERTLISSARAVWGLNAPIPVFAAQVQQESGWHADATSPVGAQGIAQFMPATADWIDGAYPDLGPNQPYNPTWALMALVRYDKHLYDRVDGEPECDRMAFALSAYNGGLKWVYEDQGIAASKGKDPKRYWGSVEQYNAGRRLSAWRENRGYPPRILKELQPRYSTWGRTISCSGSS